MYTKLFIYPICTLALLHTKAAAQDSTALLRNKLQAVQQKAAAQQQKIKARQDQTRSYQEKTRSVYKSRVVVNGKVIEDKTLYDSSTRKVLSKKVSAEIPCAADASIYINNEYRNINILPSEGNSLKIETTAYYTGDVKLTDAEWFRKLNISIQGGDKLVTVTSGSMSANLPGVGSQSVTYHTTEPPAMPEPPANATIQTTTSTTTSVTTTNDGSKILTVIANPSKPGNQRLGVINGHGDVLVMSNSGGRELTIYLPKMADLHVTSKYAGVTIAHDVLSADINITSASLDMQNATTANISCSYGNIKAGDVKNAVIALRSGKLFVKNVGIADLKTQYSKVEGDHFTSLKIESTSDDYDLETVNNFSGTKNYGDFKLSTLTGSFELTGRSADVRIKNIDPAVIRVNIDNKYADMRLPVTALRNYSVNFSGNYTNIYAPFELKTSSKPVSIGNNDSVQAVSTSRTQNDFDAVQGNISGMHTSFVLKCQSCTLDFK